MVDDATGVRDRVLDAAFSAFMENGYARTSTLEIATRARVSKRELYALVGNKQDLLVACIGDRAKRFSLPQDLPRLRDRKTFTEALTRFGATVLNEVSDPAVIGVFRLAIAEVSQAPEVARALDASGRRTTRQALREIMRQGEAAGLITGHPEDLADEFAGLLWRDLLVSLLLGVADRPSPHTIGKRAREAVEAFLRLHT